MKSSLFANRKQRLKNSAVFIQQIHSTPTTEAIVLTFSEKAKQAINEERGRDFRSGERIDLVV